MFYEFVLSKCIVIKVRQARRLFYLTIYGKWWKSYVVTCHIYNIKLVNTVNIWQFARGNVIFIRGLEISLQKRVAYILITSHVNMNNLDALHVVSDMYIWLYVYKNSSWSIFCFLFYLAFRRNVYSLITSKGAIK